jgi:hypothetical protein
MDGVGNYSSNGPHRTPVFSANWRGQAAVVGLAVFASAYVVTIPSWVNEKKIGVSINKTVWLPAFVALLYRWAFGLFGSGLLEKFVVFCFVLLFRKKERKKVLKPLDCFSRRLGISAVVARR